MIITIENVKTRLTIGGKDNLVDPELLNNLREYMSIEVPGSYFARKHTSMAWDGKKYFITPKGSMATGFVPVLLKYLDNEYPELEVTICDNRESVPRFTSVFRDIIPGKAMQEEYDYQKSMIQAVNKTITFRGQDLYFPRGVLDAATNAGKTVIMAGIYLNTEKPERMLILIHKKTIYRELVNFFKTVVPNVGQVNDQHYDIRPLTIAMVQSLYVHIDDLDVMKDLAGFTMLGVDEAHRAGSPMYAKVLSHCSAGVRVFVSGTPFDSENISHNMIIVGLSGPKLASISKKELKDRGISTPVVAHVHLCNTVLSRPILTYDEHIKTLIHQSAERLYIISNIVYSRIKKGPVIIAVEETEHGKIIYEYLCRGNISFDVQLTHSKDPSIISKIDAFRTGQFSVLISTGVLKEGVNLPLIQTLIYASGGRSKVYLKQWMGRIERRDESKTEVEVHDFMDHGKYVGKDSDARIRTYETEEIPVHYWINESSVLRQDMKKVKTVIK
jgi:superfamily II DNA or RNA helicase